MKHLSDGPTSDNSHAHERRVDSLQVSVIKASAFSASGDLLSMHERHFSGDTGTGEGCFYAKFYCNNHTFCTCICGGIFQSGNG